MIHPDCGRRCGGRRTGSQTGKTGRESREAESTNVSLFSIGEVKEKSDITRAHTHGSRNTEEGGGVTSHADKAKVHLSGLV